MQGMFYGGFQGKKRYMLPLLSKIGAERENTDNMMGYIFQSIQLPENFEQLGDDDWVKALFTSGGSMNINYLEGGLFEDLSSYLLEVEGLTCTRTLDYGVNTYFYSGYDSLEIQRFERKSDARWTANSSEKEMGHPSLLKEKLEWSDGLNCNAAQLIPNIVLPPVVKEESPFVINKNGVLVKYTGTEEEVVIPKECKSIGTRAFQNNESLKRVIIPKGVIEVGESAFYRCTALEYLELPEKLKKIGEFAFAETALEKVELPEGLKTLGRWAFDAKLKELTIPASLGSLNEYSYGDFELEDYFRNLEKINVAEGNKNYYVKEGVLYRAKAKEIFCYVVLKQ